MRRRRRIARALRLARATVILWPVSLRFAQQIALAYRRAWRGGAGW